MKRPKTCEECGEHYFETEAEHALECDPQRLYMCDGCERVGTHKELEPHILAQEWPDIKCWGLMGIGGIAYEEYVTKGIHPMSRVFNQVETLALEYNIHPKEEGT